MKDHELSDLQNRIDSMKSELSTKEAALEQTTQQMQSLSDSLRIQKTQLDAMQTELQKAQEAAANSSRQALEKMMATQEDSPGAQDLQSLLRSTQRQLEKMKAELSEKEQKMILLEAEKATSSRRLKEALATIDNEQGTALLLGPSADEGLGSHTRSTACGRASARPVRESVFGVREAAGDQGGGAGAGASAGGSEGARVRTTLQPTAVGSDNGFVAADGDAAGEGPSVGAAAERGPATDLLR